MIAKGRFVEDPYKPIRRLCHVLFKYFTVLFFFFVGGYNLKVLWDDWDTCQVDDCLGKIGNFNPPTTSSRFTLR